MIASQMLLVAAVVAGDPAYSVFFRNQENAAVRIPVSCDEAETCVLSGSVGGVPCEPRQIELFAEHLRISAGVTRIGCVHYRFYHHIAPLRRSYTLIIYGSAGLSI